jgi:DNA-binding MarR family transcriptional regulator
MSTISSARSEISDQARALQAALLDLLPLVQLQERELASAHGVSTTQCLALRLHAEGRPLTVTDVASLLHLDKSTASRVAAGLIDKGYLTRAHDPADGRVVWLDPTPAGHRLRVRLEEARCERYAEVVSDFDPEVRAVITRLVSRLAASLAARANGFRST